MKTLFSLLFLFPFFLTLFFSSPTQALEFSNVQNEYIIMFNKYMDHEEHQHLLEDALHGMDHQWHLIKRSNAASIFPSDFALISVLDESVVPLLKHQSFVKSIIPQRRIVDPLKGYEEDEDVGDVNNNNNESDIKGVVEEILNDDNSTIHGRQHRGFPNLDEGIEVHMPGSRKLHSNTFQVTDLFNAHELWGKYTGTNVRVAIFDTGLKRNHPHFRNVIDITNWTDEDTTEDGLGHGTFVAGVVASSSECLGFAPDANLHVYRVFTNNRVSYTSWFLDAFNHALRTGIDVLNLSSIVTPNKKAFSGSYQLWTDIFSAAGNGSGIGGYMFHESSVGAGLPIISTLKDLVETGDEIHKIEGVFSGTMSYLFNSFQPTSGGGGKFSAEVKSAKDQGFTEPDARDDLNGLDVARKLTILARLAGLKVESPTSFKVQSLIPKELESCSSGDEFLQRLPEFDGDMDKLKSEAEKEGKVVRFVGSLNVQSGELEVGLKKFDKSHPIAALKGSDNIVTFSTKRYANQPLVIQGAGAGGEVTAMGVTADLIKVLRLLH